MNHDRLLEARRAHRKDGQRCAECRKPWPCIVAHLADELAKRDKKITQLSAKPNVPEALASRPNLPRLAPGGTRDWRPREVLEQVRWLFMAVCTADTSARSVIQRAHEDTDECLGSPPAAGSGSVNYDRDGSRNGPTQQKALAHERVTTDTFGRQLSRVWVDDQIPHLWQEYLRGIELAGDVVEAQVVPALRKLLGMNPSDAKELVNPKPAQCENDNCQAWKSNDGSPSERLIVFDRDGKRRCVPCDRYIRRTQEERPAHLAQAS